MAFLRGKRSINRMLKKITLTKDHLKMIPFFYIQEKNENEVSIDREHMFSLGSHLLEDMAFVLGLIDKAIPSSVNDSEGRAFPQEITDYMMGIYHYIAENLVDIESLIHYYVTKGGLTEGTYFCKDYEMLWEKENL